MSETSSQRTQVRFAPPGSLSSEPAPGGGAPGGGSSKFRVVAGSGISRDMLDEQPTIISRNPLAPSAVMLATYSPNELGRMLEGERLGHFDLQEFIGGGGMGAVFRALDTMLNRIVAVKVLSQDQASDEEGLKRFKNEAQSAARLDHEHISRVYYVGEDRGLHYIVFEYIEGINLRDLVVQNGPLPIEDAISYTLQIADALHHASDRDVVHRDIKPSNVLITREGRAKVVDMGLARLHQIAQPDQDLTESGVTLGTFDYISPEQARDPRAADVRSDLYSLGCTLYFLLTGRPPFPEGTVLQKLLQHQGDEPADPRTFREDLPDELFAIIRKLMAKSPSARYQTPAELQTALWELSAKLGVSPRGGESGVRPALAVEPGATWKRHLPWAAPVVGLLIVIGVLNWFSSVGEDPLPPLSGASVAPFVGRTPGEGTNPDGKQKSTPSLPATDREKGNSSPATPAAIGVGADGEKRVAVNPSIPSVKSPTAPFAGMPRFFEGEINSAENPLVSPGRHTLTDPGPLGRMPGIVARVEPAAAPRKGVLVVAGQDNDPDTFASIHAAIAAAKNNDVIELRYNGRLEEKPFAINNLRLTIRAAEGFQPIVAFRPSGEFAGTQRGMITVVGGQLSLINLAIDMDLAPEAVLETWSLCELQNPELLRVENCWLTIRNAIVAGRAFHRDVAFFDITSTQLNDSMTLTGGQPTASPIGVNLKNCVVRGEATLVRSNDLQSIHLQWDNGLFVSSERLWSSDGGEHPVRHASGIQIDVRHLTAVARGGFCHFWNTSDSPHQLEADIRCGDSLLLGGEGANLIEQSGVDRVHEFQQRISWTGNRNFYEGFASYWRIRGSDSENSPQAWAAREWFEHWGPDHENSFRSGHVGWLKLPDAKRPAHGLTPADFQLDANEDNPARRAASDGRNVGMISEQLPPGPQIPQPPPGPQNPPAADAESAPNVD